MILDEGGFSASEKEMLFAEDSKWRFSQLGNILTMDVLVMTDILIIALGNVNFSKRRKVLRAYWMSIVGEWLVFLSALNPPLYSSFDFNGIQAVSLHARHHINTEEVKAPASSISWNKQKVSSKEEGKKIGNQEVEEEGNKASIVWCQCWQMCRFAAIMGRTLYCTVVFYPGFSDSCRISTELQQILDQSV